MGKFKPLETRGNQNSGPAPEAVRAGQVLLASAPWPLFDRPSIQLGALKAFLCRHLPLLRVDACHFYLNIAQALGYPLYEALSERSWVAESPYAALLYPHRFETVKRFWRRKTRHHPLLTSMDFRGLCARIEAATLAEVDCCQWDDYALAGFSVCLSQLTSSLYFIREIKRRAPRLPVVAGGSACAGALGQSLVQGIPEIDYVIQGEGELPLLHLTEAILAGNGTRCLSNTPGILQKENPASQEAVHQVPSLNDLPIPDYRDYFRKLEASAPDQRFLPRLPVEISRGCWWNRGGTSERGGGCVFCNLNIQWRGYRAKSPERTVFEIDTLVHRHQALSIYLMDNLLPARGLIKRFQAIKGLGKDIQLHAEIRAKTEKGILEAMASAGMEELQAGIESLSTRLLKKLNKGTTALDNLEIMKHCENPRLPNLTGNLILGFPSSDARDVSETLHHLSFACPFRPLKGIDLWLGYGSRLWQDPAAYGIRVTGNHPSYRHLFPAKILGKLRLIMQGYYGGVRHQRRLWAPVREKLAEWADRYGKLHQKPGFEPILSYRDGGAFLIIRERRPSDDPMTHRLEGTSRAIYLFCDTQRSMADILDRFPRFGEDQVRPFLRMMIDKRLMVGEADRFLSLAVNGSRVYR